MSDSYDLPRHIGPIYCNSSLRVRRSIAMEHSLKFRHSRS